MTARDPARAAELDRQLYDVSEAVRIAGVLLTPVMPRSCREVLARVGSAVDGSDPNLDRDGVWATPPGAGRQIAKGDPLWPRLDPDRAATNVETDMQRKASPPRAVVGRKVRAAADVATGAQQREQRTMKDGEQSGAGEAVSAEGSPQSEVGGSAPVGGSAAPVGTGAGTEEAAAPETPRISIDDFARVELRVGRVVTAEAVRKSKKLLRLEIDDGGGVRQVVAGIAKAYEPERLVGRHVVFVANLQPAKLMGIDVERHGARGARCRRAAGAPGPRRPRARSRRFGDPMIDSHCHLADEQFAADLDAVVARAHGAAWTGAVHPRPVEWRGGRPCRPCRRGVAGCRLRGRIHPHQAGAVGDATGGPDGVASFVRGAAEARRGTCAIGEIGLDYHYDFAPRETQIEVFRRQIALAREMGWPVVIHTREADDDTVDALHTEGRGDVEGVFHCFTGDAAFARRALDLGFHVSFSGIVTFRNATAIREAAAIVPPDRLLAETDAPYLSPVPYRGRRNEPARVSQVIDTLAEVRGVDRADIIRGNPAVIPTGCSARARQKSPAR